MPNVDIENYRDRILAANAMSSSVQYLTARNYLDVLGNNSSSTVYISPKFQSNDFAYPIRWIKIEQIGKNITSSSHYYFSTIQKILLSCHAPQKQQVVFLIQGDGVKVSLYLGLRFFSDGDDNCFAEYLSSYIKTIWPGTTTNYIYDQAKNGPSEELFDKSSKKVFAFTGIPSFLKKEGEESLTSIDALIGTLAKKKFSYIVIADPVPEYRVSGIIDKCNEMAGQLESVKSFNFTESQNNSNTHTTGEVRGVNKTHTDGKSVSTKNKAAQGILAGLSLAAGMCFGPAAGKLPGLMADTITKMTASPHFGLGVMTASNIMSGFIPQEGSNSSNSTTNVEQHSSQDSFTEGQAKSISTTIVNRNVDYTLKRLDSQIARFENGLGEGMWRTASFLISDDESIAESAAMQYRSIISGKNSHLEPVRIHDLSYLRRQSVFSVTLNRYSFPLLPIVYKDDSGENEIENPFEGDYTQLSTYLTTEELSCLINFPQKSVPGISVIDSTPDFSLSLKTNEKQSASLKIGKLLYAGAMTDISIDIPTSVFSRHSLVTGVNGSGKTNTVTKILDGFINWNIPFLVLEPAKTEYVDWAISFNTKLKEDKSNGKRLNENEILIFAPGKTAFQKRESNGSVSLFRIKDEFKFNPFEVISMNKKAPETSDVLAHIDRIKSTFAAAFPIYDILPVVMETVLYHLYTSGEPWLTNNDDKKRRFPTLSLMSACIPGVVESLGYDQKTRDNITAAMMTRINSLLRGWKGEMLNNERITTYTWDQIFNSKCIINLSAFGDDVDRSFIMSLILQMLYEYRIAESSSPDFSFSNSKTRHLVVVEEAHRVMSGNGDYNSPQYKSGIMFSNMLSEIRAYGQGLMIVDQVPSRLIPDAIKNTNLKIIHRLISADDIATVSDSMGLSQSQRMIIPRLSTGQAIISGIYSGQTQYTSDSDIFWSKIRFHEED